MAFTPFLFTFLLGFGLEKLQQIPEEGFTPSAVPSSQNTMVEPESKISDVQIHPTQKSTHPTCQGSDLPFRDSIDLVNTINPEGLLQIATHLRVGQVPAIMVSEEHLDGSYNLVSGRPIICIQMHPDA